MAAGASAAKTHSAPPRGRFAAKFLAWWDGREYVEAGSEPEPAATAAAVHAPDDPTPDAAAPAPSVAETDPDLAWLRAPAPTPAAPPPPAPRAALPVPRHATVAQPDGTHVPEDGLGDPRTAALMTVWGEGCFNPHDPRIAIDIAEALDLVVATSRTVAVVGANLPLVAAVAEVTSARLHLMDWRKPCLDRLTDGLGRLSGRCTRQVSDPDRLNPQPPPPGGLAGLVTLEAMTFADYKPGLVQQAWRALRPGARWVLLDWVAEPPNPPGLAAGFASAWVTPQPMGHRSLPRLLTEGGFTVVSDQSAGERIARAAERAFRSLPGRLEDFTRVAKGPEGALALKELAWELSAWKLRLKLLGAGGMDVRLIVATRDPDPSAD